MGSNGQHKLSGVNAAMMNGMPGLEEQATAACLEEIKAVLQKYNRELMYQEVTQNGLRVSGTMVVVVPNR